MIKKLFILILGLNLILTACSKDNKDTNLKNGEDKKVEEINNTKNSTNISTQNSEIKDNKDIVANIDTKEVKMTKEEAYEEFLKAYPNAKVDSLSYGKDNGISIYEVEGYDDMNEYEIKFDASNGQIVGQKQDKEASNKTLFISKEQLQKIDLLIEDAAKDFEDFISYEYTLDFDNNKLEFKVELKNTSKEVEYKYDYETEKLIEKDM